MANVVDLSWECAPPKIAIRVATITAVGRRARAVFKEDIAWGIDLARESFKAADGGAERYMHEYFEFPKQCERVAEALVAAKFSIDLGAG
jgi:hypothetical protein